MGRRRVHEKTFSFTCDTISYPIRVEIVDKLIHLGKLENEFWQVTTQRHRIRRTQEAASWLALRTFFLISIRADRIYEYWLRINKQV